MSGSQREIKIDFYQSDSTDVDFDTDSGVDRAPGRGLVLETPEAWKTKDIEINLYFGGTEITTVFFDSRLFKSKRLWKRFQDFRQSYR